MVWGFVVVFELYDGLVKVAGETENIEDSFKESKDTIKIEEIFKN